MNRVTFVLWAVAFTSGCVGKEAFRPRHAAMEATADSLQCDEVSVAFAPLSEYRRDPISRDLRHVIVWGCGRYARLTCDVFGTRNGHCVEDTIYESPPTDTPHGIVKIRTHYRTASGRTQRELTRINGDAIVRQADPMGRAVAIPVAAGSTHWDMSTAPVVETHHVSSYVGYHTVSLNTWTERSLAQGCGRQFSLDVIADATYRVELDYAGPNQCSVTCAREVETPSGPALIACANFQQR